MLRGGYGLDAFGRHQYGNRSSAIEPRFNHSVPGDGQHNVPNNQVLKFDTYCYSSFIDVANVKVYISENKGATFSVALENGVFQAPYDGKVRRLGQRFTVYLSKAGVWPPYEKIVIRFVGFDEFGQPATKVMPVKWAT